MGNNKFGFATQLMQESIKRRQQKKARATQPKPTAKKPSLAKRAH